MKNLYTTIVLAVILSINATVSYAQDSNVMYFMHESMEANELNPALQYNRKVMIYLPVVGGAKINYSGLINPDHFNNFETLLEKQQDLKLNSTFMLGGLGFHFGNLELRFAAHEKINLGINLPQESGLDYPEDVLSLDMMHRREYSIGVSNKFADKFTFGFKYKYLQGVSNISLVGNEESASVRSSSFPMIALNENDEISSASINDFNIVDYLSLPVMLNEDGSVEYNSTPFGNTGHSIDFGFNWDIIKEVSISGSVLDLGYIDWEADVNNTNTEDLYKTWLPTKMFLAAKYQPYKSLGLGVLSRTGYFNENVNQSFTASANLNVLKILSLAGSYTFGNSLTHNAVGAGVIVRLPLFLKLSLYVDNINPVLESNPWNTRYVNVRAGLNMSLFRIKDDKTPEEENDLEVLEAENKADKSDKKLVKKREKEEDKLVEKRKKKEKNIEKKRKKKEKKLVNKTKDQEKEKKEKEQQVIKKAKKKNDKIVKNNKKRAEKLANKKQKNLDEWIKEANRIEDRKADKKIDELNDEYVKKTKVSTESNLQANASNVNTSVNNTRTVTTPSTVNNKPDTYTELTKTNVNANNGVVKSNNTEVATDNNSYNQQVTEVAETGTEQNNSEVEKAKLYKVTESPVFMTEAEVKKQNSAASKVANEVSSEKEELDDDFSDFEMEGIVVDITDGENNDTKTEVVNEAENTQVAKKESTTTEEVKM